MADVCPGLPVTASSTGLLVWRWLEAVGEERHQRGERAVSGGTQEVVLQQAAGRAIGIEPPHPPLAKAQEDIGAATGAGGRRRYS